MKKINILIFIMLIFAFILTGCSGSKASGVTEGVKVNKEDLKIGFVHYSDPSDQGYTYTHDSSTWKMAAALGIDKSQIINKYNVPDTAEHFVSLLRMDVRLYFQRRMDMKITC